MEHALAEAEAKKLREREEVESAETKMGKKGVYIEVTPASSYDRNVLESELYKYNVWIELTEDQ